MIQEISTAIQKLKSGKAAGPDNITAEHIKYGGHIVIKWLYNRILSLEEIPSCLKLGTITPIYKSKGKDPLLVESYRGITISSVLSKLLESIILKRLNHTLDNLNILIVSKLHTEKVYPAPMQSSPPKKPYSLTSEREVTRISASSTLKRPSIRLN